MGDVGDFEANMVLGEQAFARRRLVVEHELDVVSSVGNLEINPTEEFAATAAPDLGEAKYVSIKFKGGVELADHDADVAHPSGDAGVGQKFTLLTVRPAIGQIFDNLDRVAVGILDEVVFIADSTDGGFGRDCDAIRLKVNAHSLGVVGLEGDVVKSVGVRGNFGGGEKFHALAIVDFDPHEALAGSFARDGKGRLETQVVFVESTGLGHVGDVKRGVCDPRDARAAWKISAEYRRGENTGEDEHSEFHGRRESVGSQELRSRA